MPTHFLARALTTLRQQQQRLVRWYGARPDVERRRHRNLAIAALVPVFGAVAAFGFVPLDDDAPLARQIELALSTPDTASAVVPLDLGAQQFIHEERVRRGDTLGALLTRLTVNDSAAEAFVRSDPPSRALYQLRPGRVMQAATDANGSLMWLRYMRMSGDSGSNAAGDSIATSALVLERQGTSFVLHEDHTALGHHTELRTAQIDTSLFAATDRAGIPDSIATQIADIFSGEIDFYRDPRRGDTLRVVYEINDCAGGVALPGRVLAAEFINGGHSHQAVWYPDGNQGGAYYGPQGESLKRAFLRSPLQFTRISSGFGGRLHPILNIWRQHTGVDYAAPIGTPVRSTSDGSIDFVGVQQGYGNVIIVRHSGSLSTVYGHLSAFAPGLHRGQRVSQGDMIGRVGMTGWATGPHLHYEFRVDGVARDPLRVILPPAEPIAPAQLAAFRESTAGSDRMMDVLRDIDSARHTAAPADPA
jgi:murein DD-endopeptidase MepM/ murein hydrolase activator NlpD